MINKIGLLAVVFFMAGCSSIGFLENISTERITTVKEDRDGLTYLSNENKPYTGKYDEHFENGKKSLEISYRDGKE
ncbi:MAG: hypothetical protein WCP01_11765, partial [Methylococcaceae bacterium]